MSAKTVLAKLFGRNANALPEPVVYELGATGRESVDNPNESFYDSRIAPTLKPGPVTRTLDLEPIPIKQLKKRSIASIIADWIDTNSDLSFIVRSYLDYTISDFELDTDNDKSRRRIEGFIDDMGRGGDNFLAFLKRLLYGGYVEGAISYEISWSPDGKKAISFDYVPPFSLEFRRRQAKGYNRYYQIVQYAKGPFQPPVVLQDKANPNPFYRYAPLNVSGTNPYGNSLVEPALWGIVGRQQLLGSLIGFIQGEIFPSGVYAPDLRALLSASPNIHLTAKNITEYGNKIAEIVKAATDGKLINKNMVSSFPLIYEVVGRMKDANFEPMDIMTQMLASGIQLGGRLPNILYLPENLRTGIGDQKTRIDWTSFDDRCATTESLVEDEVSYGFDMVLLADRTSDRVSYAPEVRLNIIRNDAEIQRIRSEAFKLKMEGYTAAKALELFADWELRKMIIEGKYDFNELDFEMPTKLTRNPEPKKDEEA